jgi:hypothetical protein
MFDSNRSNLVRQVSSELKAGLCYEENTFWHIE